MCKYFFLHDYIYISDDSDLQRFIKKRILTSSVGEAGSRMIRTNIEAFRHIGGTFPLETNAIHCVFSGSDVGNKCRLLCSLLHPTTKHINRLGVILVYTCSGVETMGDWWQLTQDRSDVTQTKKRRTAWFEKGVMILVDKKKHKKTGWIFIITGWLCTYTANTHWCSNNM